MREKGLFPSTSAPWQQEILDGLLSVVTIPKDGICLDAACGIGNNTETLLGHFKKVFSFDKSVEAIEFSQRRHAKYIPQRVSFSIGSLESIPYEDALFDGIVCTEALEHVLVPHIAIEEIFRVTKSGGYVILSFQNHFNPSSILKFIFEIVLKKNWDVWNTHGHDEGYENYLTCFQVKRTVKEVGFVTVKELGADYINAWLSWAPFFYRNYRILDRYPLTPLGKLPFLKYLGMDFFILLKKP